MNTMPKIEKLSEFGKKILQIAVDSSYINQQNLTQKAVFDILSLEPNISKIEGNEIFLKNKRRRHGKLNQKKFSKYYSFLIFSYVKTFNFSFQNSQDTTKSF